MDFMSNLAPDKLLASAQAAAKSTMGAVTNTMQQAQDNLQRVAAGDFSMVEELFRNYADELIPTDGVPGKMDDVYFGKPTVRELRNNKNVAELHGKIENFQGFLYHRLHGRLCVRPDLLQLHTEHYFMASFDRYNPRSQFLIKCKIRRKPIFDFNEFLFTHLLRTCFAVLKKYDLSNGVLYFPIGKPQQIGIQEHFSAALHVSNVNDYWSHLRRDLLECSEKRDGQTTSRLYSQAEVFEELKETLMKTEEEKQLTFQLLTNSCSTLFVDEEHNTDIDGFSRKQGEKIPLSTENFLYSQLHLVGFRCNRPLLTPEDGAKVLDFVLTSFMKNATLQKVHVCFSLGNPFKFSRQRGVYAFFEKAFTPPTPAVTATSAAAKSG